MSRKKNRNKKKDAAAAAVRPSDAKPRETLAEFAASLIITLIIALFIITFNLQPFKIPSSSMEKTLLIGDHLFVDRISLAPAASWMPLLHHNEIHRNDIIVFFSPAQPDLHLVKRVIGIPGDRIHLRGGVLFRNGERINEPYVVHDGTSIPYRDNFPSVPPQESPISLAPNWLPVEQSYIQGDDIVVPKDSYFAMGDNRDVSFDSRYWGFVPRANIVGRPLFIWWSFDDPSGDPGILSEIIHFFDKTRWSRTFHMAR